MLVESDGANPTFYSMDLPEFKKNKPEIIPEQVEVVRKIYDLLLSGTPIRGIQEYLEQNDIPIETHFVLQQRAVVITIIGRKRTFILRPQNWLGVPFITP